MNKSLIICELMCEVTLTVLHKHMKQKKPFIDAPLMARVGSGKSTYYSHSDKSITYGIKMLESKLIKRFALSWTTGREIIDRSYFNGEATYKNLLVATVLHEYAHYIQRGLGLRTRNSVHNEHFYKILDSFYALNMHVLVMDEMNKNIVFAAAEFSDDTTTFNKSDLLLATYVSFLSSRTNKVSVVKIKKLNPKTVVAERENGAGVKIPYSLINGVFTEKPEDSLFNEENEENKDNVEKVKFPDNTTGNVVKRKRTLTKEDLIGFKAIKFEVKNKLVIGKIIKINLKTVSVETKDFGGFRVPYSLIKETLNVSEYNKDPIDSVIRKSSKSVSENKKTTFSQETMTGYKTAYIMDKGKLLECEIQKLNPKKFKAMIKTLGSVYNVPYGMVVKLA